ncbi:MAG: hypothetical protein IPJ06_19285 [Saprospiraceae bacterium]|nr:hypothetical protein [Saprospiraceae bacterium]
MIGDIGVIIDPYPITIRLIDPDQSPSDQHPVQHPIHTTAQYQIYSIVIPYGAETMLAQTTPPPSELVWEEIKILHPIIRICLYLILHLTVHPFRHCRQPRTLDLSYQKCFLLWR